MSDDGPADSYTNDQKKEPLMTDTAAATPPARSFTGRLASQTLAGVLAMLKDLGKWMLRSIAISAALFAVAYVLLPRPKPLTSDTTLFVGIDRPLAEASPLDSMPFLQFVLNPPKLSASMIDGLIRDAADDPKIFRIVLSLDGMIGTGAGAANRIGDALDAARAKGKAVVAYASNFDNASWLLASHADEILMHPMGRFDVGGLKTGALYYGEALKRFGVDVIVGQAGEYKSAIEPYTRGDMSPPARQALSRVMDRQHAALVDVMARRARMTPADMDRALASWNEPTGEAYDAETAVSLGLVDRALSTPEFMDATFGAPGAEDTPSTIALSRYSTLNRHDQCAADWRARGIDRGKKSGSIGVVTIEGPIMPGLTTAEHAGAASLVAQVEAFARDEVNKALLVRIDSPGGDAQASEHIRSVIARYRSLGRPVAVSMGSTAASGGYWIATAGGILFAEPTTITGSIGVFSIRASAAGVLEKFDIAWDGLSVGRGALPGGIAEPASADERAAISADVGRIYERFVNLVSEARGLDKSAYKDWAEGRIWQASDAKAIGLVDEIGGVEAALEALAERSGVPASCAKAAPASSPGSMLSSFSPMSVVASFLYALRWTAGAERAVRTPVELRDALAVSSMTGVVALCFECRWE